MNQTNDFILGPPIEPEVIGMHFNSPGWIALYLLLALVLLIGVLLVWRNYKKNTYRRQAVQALKKLSTKNNLSVLHAMEVLKSTAMKTYGRELLAPLSGTLLFDFMNEKYAAFEDKTTKAITNVIYQTSAKISDEEKVQFIQQSQNWIRKHGV